MYTYTRWSVHLSVLRASLSDTQPIQFRWRDDKKNFYEKSRFSFFEKKFLSINFLIPAERILKGAQQDTFKINNLSRVRINCMIPQ